MRVARYTTAYRISEYAMDIDFLYSWLGLECDRVPLAVHARCGQLQLHAVACTLFGTRTHLNVLVLREKSLNSDLLLGSVLVKRTSHYIELGA